MGQLQAKLEARNDQNIANFTAKLEAIQLQAEKLQAKVGALLQAKCNEPDAQLQTEMAQLQTEKAQLQAEMGQLQAKLEARNDQNIAKFTAKLEAIQEREVTITAERDAAIAVAGAGAGAALLPPGGTHWLSVMSGFGSQLVYFQHEMNRMQQQLLQQAANARPST